jgi:hypothetical protein
MHAFGCLFLGYSASLDQDLDLSGLALELLDDGPEAESHQLHPVSELPRQLTDGMLDGDRGQMGKVS